MTKACAVAFALALAAAGTSRAQSAEQDVREVVDRFLLNLGDHKFDAVESDVAQKSIVVIARERDGKWINSYQTGEEWLGALKKNPNPVTFREPIANVTITVDSNQLACVRADFQVLRDGKAVSSGVDQFTLVREVSGWKIAVVAYTSMPAK